MTNKDLPDCRHNPGVACNGGECDKCGWTQSVSHLRAQRVRREVLARQRADQWVMLPVPPNAESWVARRLRCVMCREVVELSDSAATPNFCPACGLKKQKVVYPYVHD